MVDTSLIGVRLTAVGSDSGILALTGAVRGVVLCVAVDLSWQAVHISRENAWRNQLTAIFQVARGSSDCLRGLFQIEVPNLPAAV